MNDFKIAIYCRLSVDDGNNESISILNQKKICEDYVKKNIIGEYEFYIDDGFSGTSFDRPSFNRLIEDINSKKIKTVVVKDLSRLGRNYLLSGYYLEEYFPQNNIRFIAINDNYDNYKSNDDFVPFKNILNEWYAKEASKKIRQIVEHQAKEGKNKKASQPLFGYMYDENLNRIPNPETAPIVLRIFEDYVKYKSSYKVAENLKKDGIKIPSYYTAVNNDYSRKKTLSKSHIQLTNWTGQRVRWIIKNRAYLGDYVLLNERIINFKTKKKKKNETPYVFEKKYEPLVTETLWKEANEILNKNTIVSSNWKTNIFPDMLICGCCGKKMVFAREKWKNNKIHYFYHCTSEKCKNCYLRISEKALKIIIYNELTNLVEKNINNRNIISSANFNVNKEIINLENSNRKLNNEVSSLFSRYMNKMINKDEYVKKIIILNEEINKNSNLISSLKLKIKDTMINLSFDKFKGFLSHIMANEDNDEELMKVFTKLLKSISIFFEYENKRKKNKNIIVNISYNDISA